MNNIGGTLNILSEHCNDMREVCFLIVSNEYQNNNFQIKCDSVNKDFIRHGSVSKSHCRSY